MNDKGCACHGLSYFSRIIDATADTLSAPPGDPLVAKRGAELANTVYGHLVEQAHKPGNKPLLARANPSLEAIRGDIAEYGEGLGSLALDTVRDKIHKDPAIQQLLLCGSPFKTDEDRLEGAKELAHICDTLSNTDDDVKPLVEKLTVKMGCAESEEEQRERFKRIGKPAWRGYTRVGD